jgi:hypothetical protein
MKAFIDDHRAVYGVEPICKVLPIAPSTYYLHATRRANPELRSVRSRRDEAMGAGSGTSISKPTALAKCGSNCGAKVWPWPVVRSSISCGKWGLKALCGVKLSRPPLATPIWAAGKE